ncbi:MAG: hydroxymethylglutaryl-CoA reductase, degradative [Nanoarchaeota archaeon]|nr:hydroxymethylglutaryl-CoA reductase, degradative [Nanoarchaeota archaeon]
MNGNQAIGDLMSSRLPEFYKKSVDERLSVIKEVASLTEDEANVLRNSGALDLGTADKMSENVIGANHFPLGIATNFIVNGKDYLIPMAIDEPSVVAAASNGAKLSRDSGGFTASSDEPIMITQIQMVNVKDIEGSKKRIMENKERLIKIANDQNAVLLKHGGGAKDIEFGVTDKDMLVLHLLVDVADAYGPNIVNTMAEAISPILEELTGGVSRLRIVSNLATKRMARARTVWKKEALASSMRAVDFTGEQVVDYILDAYRFAVLDEYRCTTHNKGIMNGIDAVTIATGNDFRGVEAGAHAYAAMGGKYKSLTKYYKDENGDLVGEIELPLAVGIVGGAININPIAKISLKILGVKSARELSEVIAAVGLAQNFAALRALATEGLQRGHMRLHSKNIAVIGGASGDLIDKVAQKMIDENKISVDRAKEIVAELNG